MLFQPSLINQPFDVFKHTDNQTAILHNGKLYIRAGFNDFAFISDKVSHLFASNNSIFIVRESILYQYDSSLIDLGAFGDVPISIFSSKFGLVQSFSSHTVFNNLSIPASISTVIEYPNDILMFNDTQLFVYHNSLSSIKINCILSCILNSNEIVIATTTGVHYYRNNECFESIPIDISAVVHRNSDLFTFQHKHHIHQFNIATRKLKTIRLDVIPKSVVYLNNALCLNTSHGIKIIFLNNFAIETFIAYNYIVDYLVPYSNSFIAVSNRIIDFHVLPFLSIDSQPFPVHQIAANNVLYNSKVYNTGLIRELKYMKCLFVISDELKVYSLDQVLSLKYSFKMQFYALDANYLYLGDGMTILQYSIDDLAKPLQQKAIKHELLDIVGSIMVTYWDSTINIYSSNTIVHSKQVRKPEMLSISRNAQFIAIYTDCLEIMSLTSFDSWKVKDKLVQFMWDQECPAFMLNGCLYCLFDDVYFITKIDACNLHLPYYYTAYDAVTPMKSNKHTLSFFQHDTSCLFNNIMDFYELQKCSTDGYKTCLILFILLKHPFKHYCQIQLQLYGTDEELLMQLNVDLNGAKKKFEIPDVDAPIQSQIKYYKSCPSSLLYSVLDRDYSKLAPLINRNEVYALIGDYKQSIEDYQSALEHYTLSGQSTFSVLLKLGKAPKPVEKLDFYHLAATSQGDDVIKCYSSAKCSYHILDYIKENISTLNEQFVVNTLMNLEMDKEGMKQVGIVLEGINKQQSNLYYDKIMNISWKSAEKISLKESLSVDKKDENMTSRDTKVSPVEKVMLLLDQKSYKSALKLIITEDIKITKDMHSLLNKSREIELGDIYVKMGYLDYALEYYLTHKEYQKAILTLDLRIQKCGELGDYNSISALLETKIKLMSKLKTDTSDVRRDLELVNVFVKGLRLDNEECLRVMEALIGKCRLIRDKDIKQVIKKLESSK